MASAVQQLPLKPIIIHRSYSLPGPDAPDTSRSSSLSSSPTSSTGPSACGPPTAASHDAQRHSGSPAQSIVFAPLPVIEPRRKKSNVQLGVAARSRMLQQRKAWREEMARREASPMWTDLDESAVRAAEKEAEEEDPVVVMGRYLAGKSKHLWRRMSKKEKGRSRQGGEREGEGEKRDEAQESRSSSPPPESDEGHEGGSQEDEQGKDSEGGVWEEETNPEFQSHFAQRTPKEDSGKKWTWRRSVVGSP